MTDLVLRGGCVLTMSGAGNHRAADVLIEDGRVSEIGPRVRVPRGTEVIDATDTIVMPGFVDAHRHVWESLFCGLGDLAHDAPSEASLFGPHCTGEDVYAATSIGLLRGVEAGITSVVDWYDAADEHVDAALQAHADSGVRSVFVKAAPAWSDGRRASGGALRRLTGSSAGGPLVTFAAGVDDPTTGAFDAIEAEWALARELGLRIHAHTGRSPFEEGVVAALGSRQMLGPDVTFAHCTHLGGADLDAIAQSGASVVLTPSTDMAEGMGSPPLQGLIDRKLRPGLGVDGERIAPGDAFAQMRAVISLQHASYFDLKLAGKGGLPRLLTTREVIRWATSDGARAAGLGDLAGSLQPGRPADLIVLRADRPNIAPVNDPIGAVVWGMDTSNLDTVLVGGRVLMRDGALEADVARVREQALASRSRLAASAGPVGASGGAA